MSLVFTFSEDYFKITLQLNSRRLIENLFSEPHNLTDQVLLEESTKQFPTISTHLYMYDLYEATHVYVV